MIIENFADYFIGEYLKKFKIDRIFVYPGGTIAPLVNSAIKFGLQVETFKTEQGAGYAALSYSMAKNIPQLLMVTSGPGLTNVISCICDSYFDSIPLVIVSGQVGTGDLLSNRQVRQTGFQQVDGASMMKHVTKYSSCVKSEAELSQLQQILRLAEENRPGPVFFELPMDIQRKAFSDTYFETNCVGDPGGTVAALEVTQSDLDIFYQQYNSAKRPLALIGAGAVSSNETQNATVALLRKLKLPFVSSFRGIGLMSYSDELNLGYLGHTGHQEANLATYNSDFLLVLGSRLDVRQTGSEVNDFSHDRAIYSVNNDHSELVHSRVELSHQVCADILQFVNKAIENAALAVGTSRAKWRDKLSELKATAENDVSQTGHIFSGRRLVKAVSNITEKASVGVVTGVGSHQHWVARHFDFYNPGRRLFSSAGHGTMGYDVPASVGVAMSETFDLTLCFVGDGSIMHNICELRSAVDRNLNIAFFVFRNRRLGIVSQFQKITFGSDPTTSDFDTGDLCKIAEGFGLYSTEINCDDYLGLERFLSQKNGPRLAVIDIPTNEDVSPMLLGGSKLNELWRL
jgi:acetolactate synthase-1/2/3 large subunit